MSFLTKMENTYLAILRVTILLIASLTLLAAILMAVTSLPAFLSVPEKEEVTIDKSEYPKLDNYLQEHKATSAVIDENVAPDNNSQSNSESSSYGVSKKEAAKTLKSYIVSIINGATVTEDLILKDIFSKTENGIPEQHHDDFYKSINALVIDLAKKSKEQKAVYERYYDYNSATQDKNFIDVFALIDWHRQKFVENLESKDAEQNAMIAEAEAKKSNAKESVMFAAGCFGFFVFFVFLFIIIKIERNLRVISERPSSGTSGSV